MKFLHNTSKIINFTTEKSLQQHVADAKWNKNFRLGVLWAEIIMGSFGGILLLFWLYFNRRRRSRVNMVLLNVAVADLLVILYSCLFQLIIDYDREWKAGNLACKLFKFLQTLFLVVSSYMMIVLSVDRLQAICWPLKRHLAVWKLSSLAWSTSIFLSLPQFYIFHTNYVKTIGPFQNKTTCESIFRTVSLSHRQAYLTFTCVMFFWLPMIVLCYCYVRIYVKIYGKSKRNGRAAVINQGRKDHDECTKNEVVSSSSYKYNRCNSTNTSTSTTSASASNSKRTRNNTTITAVNNSILNLKTIRSTKTPFRNDHHTQSAADTESRKSLLDASPINKKVNENKILLISTSNTLIPKAKIKTLKMAIIIVSSYVLFGLPYTIFEMILSYGNNNTMSPIMSAVFAAMAPANSVLNPFIILLFNSKSKLMDCFKWHKKSDGRKHVDSSNFTMTTQ